MALYTAQKLAGKRAQVEAAQTRALRDDAHTLNPVTGDTKWKTSTSTPSPAWA